MSPEERTAVIVNRAVELMRQRFPREWEIVVLTAELELTRAEHLPHTVDEPDGDDTVED